MVSPFGYSVTFMLSQAKPYKLTARGLLLRPNFNVAELSRSMPIIHFTSISSRFVVVHALQAVLGVRSVQILMWLSMQGY